MTPQFLQIRNIWINVRFIIQVKRTTPTLGADKILRDFVITMSSETDLELRYRQIWANEEEAQELILWFEMQRLKIKK